VNAPATGSHEHGGHCSRSKMVAIVITIVLILAGVGAYIVGVCFIYRRYFKAVNAILSRSRIGSLMALPSDEMLRLDNVVRRCYYAKKSVEQTASDVLAEAVRPQAVGHY
jgi:tellurite resistance protein TehA-like permease